MGGASTYQETTTNPKSTAAKGGLACLRISQTLTVVFPDVVVGNTVVFSYQLVQTDPLFPKQFSIAQTFSDQFAIDDLRVRFDYPASLWVQDEPAG